MNVFLLRSERLMNQEFFGFGHWWVQNYISCDWLSHECSMSTNAAHVQRLQTQCGVSAAAFCPDLVPVSISMSSLCLSNYLESIASKYHVKRLQKLSIHFLKGKLVHRSSIYSCQLIYYIGYEVIFFFN